MVCLLSTVFLNTAIPTDLKDKLGYVIMLIASLSILINLSLVAKDTIVQIYVKFDKARQSYMTSQELKRLYALKAKLLKEFPDKF